MLYNEDEFGSKAIAFYASINLDSYDEA